MRVVVQRVLKASVAIEGKIKSRINQGALVFLGVEINDNSEDVLWLTNKISSLRIFADNNGVMNKSIIDIKAEVLVVSQFTLHAKTKKGNRPSYINSARPQEAFQLYNEFIDQLSIKIDNQVYSGEFGADMQVELINDGPVTIIIDTRNKE